jgi:very-short-patch-repair endonuclease
MTRRAQHLRRNMTEAERLLGRQLRANRLGHRFRRQHPIPPYVADFACIEAKLIIEADGGQHAVRGDPARDEFLRKRGWQILRIWNNDIQQNRAGVLQAIAAALEQQNRPPP